MEKPKRERDVPGNSLASAQAVTRRLVAVAEQLYRAERVLDKSAEQDTYLLQVKFRAPNEEQGTWLAVVTAWVGGVRMVAFVQDASFAECARTVWASLESKTIRWKEDTYGQS